MRRSANIHITNDCDFNCEICFEKRDGKIKYIDKDDLLRWIKINELKHIGFVGGECTLHKDLSYIISELKKMNIDTCVVTNGEHLETLTTLPNSLSIGIDNYDQEKVDNFLSIDRDCLIEITITPTDISVIDSLIEKYKKYRVNISLLAFWNRNENTKEFITEDYINKMKELKQKGEVVFWGNINNIDDFYNNENNNEYFCIAPINVYSDGSIQICDLNRFETGQNITDFQYIDIIKNDCKNEKCIDCNLRYTLK